MSEADKVRVVPSTFAESIYQLDGQPFRLTNRHYLKWELYVTWTEKQIV